MDMAAEQHHDRYAVISQIAAVARVHRESVEAPLRVVNLMEALKKSLDAVTTTKKKPAKAEVAQSAAKRKRA